MESYVLLWRYNVANEWHAYPTLFASLKLAQEMQGVCKRYATDKREYKIMILRELEIQ